VFYIDAKGDYEVANRFMATMAHAGARGAAMFPDLAYRGWQGDATAILFNQFPGNWKVGQEAGNIPAQKFWRTIIARYTRGAFQEIQEVGWNGPIQLFRTP
jgi:hypothetical protein